MVEDIPAGGGSIRVLTLNRPAKRNALDSALIQDLIDGIRAAEADASVRALVLTGAGKAFSAGGDLAEFRDAPDARTRMARRAESLGELQLTLAECELPTVAAAHGTALGAGAALALSADALFVSNDFSLGFPELAGGVVPAVVMASAIHGLDRRLAFDMLTSRRRMDAAEAVARGVAVTVLGRDELVRRAIEYAETWASAAPDAMREMKKLFVRMAEMTAAQGVAAGVDVVASTWTPPAPNDANREVRA